MFIEINIVTSLFLSEKKGKKAKGKKGKTPPSSAGKDKKEKGGAKAGKKGDSKKPAKDDGRKTPSAVTETEVSETNVKEDLGVPVKKEAVIGNSMYCKHRRGL